uniref:Fibronectin type-III domain-containing protein n=1 Tax=Romanomermis culicivorax TaxID=13658 RepID=A0A915HG81_ROMCU
MVCSKESDKQVSAPPARPGTPQIVDLDADTATLAWLSSGPMINYTNFPQENGAGCLSSTFEGYQIQFREIGEPYWQLANTKPSLETQYSVRNLNQFGHYEFRIVAKNIYGFSQPSNSSAAVKLRPKLHHVSSIYSYDK